MSDLLPEGFVLDDAPAAPTGSALPDGFVLDDPAPATGTSELATDQGHIRANQVAAERAAKEPNLRNVPGPNGYSADNPPYKDGAYENRKQPPRPAPPSLGVTDYVTTAATRAAGGALDSLFSGVKGGAVQLSANAADVKAIEDTIANVRAMPYEQAEAFRAKIRESSMSPVAKIAYESALRAAWNGDDAGAKGFLDKARMLAIPGRPEDFEAYKAAEQAQQRIGQDFAADPRLQGGTTDNIATMVGQTATYLVPGMAEIAGPLQTSDAGYDQARASMRDSVRDDRGGMFNSGLGTEAENVAREAGQAQALPGATEKLPIDFLLAQVGNRIPGFKNSTLTGKAGNLIKRIGAQVLVEGGQEAAQQYLANAINRAMVDPSFDPMDQVWENAKAGGTVGAIFQTVAEGIGLGRRAIHRVRGPDQTAPQTPPQQPQQPAPGKGDRIEPQMFPEAQNAPVRPMQSNGYDVSPQTGATADDEVLHGAGYTPQQIAEMHPAEKAQEAADARAQGVQPKPLPPAPGTAPLAPGFRPAAPVSPESNPAGQIDAEPQVSTGNNSSPEKINSSPQLPAGFVVDQPKSPSQNSQNLALSPDPSENAGNYMPARGEVRAPFTPAPMAPRVQTAIYPPSQADKAFSTFFASKAPITPESLAKASGMPQKDAVKAIQRAALRGSIIQTRQGRWMRAPTRVKPISAMQFIASIGGISDPTGELAGMDLPKMGPYGPVVRKTGLHPDKVREALVEAGYLRDPGVEAGGQATTTVNDVYALLDNEMRGQKAYQPQDQATADALDTQAKNDALPPDYAPVHHIAQRFGVETWNKVKTALDTHGLDEGNWSTQELSDAARMVNEGQDPEDALVAAAIRFEDDANDPESQLPEVQEWMRKRDPRATLLFDPPPFPDVEPANAGQEIADGESPGSAQPLAGSEGPRVEEAPRSPREEAPVPRQDGSEGQGQQPAPAVEPGADNKPQLVIPGTEPDVKGAIKNAQKAPLKGKKPQQAADEGLFGDSAAQQDFISTPPKAEEKWKEIGKNAAGHTLYEDKRNIRSYVVDGVRIFEKVQISPNGIAVIPHDRGTEFTPVKAEVKSKNWKDEGRAAAMRDEPRSAPMDARKSSPRAVSDWLDGWDAGNVAKPVPGFTPAEQQAFPSYGSANKLVSKDRASELRAKLKAKLKDQINAGIDPEMLAMGAELAAFHIEAGARRFSDFARAIASDLGVSIKAIRPYLRAWYNGARDMIEDAGIDVTGMDSPDEVKTALAALDQETTDGQQGSGLRQEAQGVPAASEPEPVQEPQPERPAGEPLPADRGAGGGNVREPERSDADVEGPADRLRGKGEGTRSNPDGRGRNRPARDRAAAPSDVEKEVAEREAERSARRALNYRITSEDKIGQGGPKEKVAANIEAIRTLKKILDEKRKATPEEKRTLVRYVGWGAFAQDVFAKHKPEWAKERAALADLLTAEEFASARASTLNAHYTSESVIKGMWTAMEHLGFKGGRALEPSSGVGHFIGLIPDKLAATTDWSAVELDTVTGNITKLLYEGSDVNVTGFEKFNRPNNFYDVAVSNVPFGDFQIRDPKRPGYLIHDYFFVKGLDLVRPGGLVAFITSSGTMDKQSQEARKAIAKRADFVGAIRLPGGRKGAFAGNAGTEVTTDIIFLRKRDVTTPRLTDAPKWLDLKTIQTPDGDAQINEYFADNPSMMLGEMRLTGTMYRDKSPVLVGDTDGIQEKIAKAAARMPESIMLDRSTSAKAKEKDTQTVDATAGKEGGYFEKDGKLYRRVQGVGQPQNLAAPDTEKVKALIGIRDIVNELLANQAKGDKTSKNDTLRERLNKAYDAFVKKHGPINLENTTTTNRQTRSGDFVVITKRPNFAKFSLDPDAFKVAAIENYDPDKKTASKAAIFTQDILGPAPKPQIASSADTIGWALNAFGRLDIDAMAPMAGVSRAQLIKDLGDLIYEDPVSGVYQPRDQYLSGDVVTKLEEAEGASEADPKYKRNVDALKAVQPAPLTREEIRVPFGAPWVPVDVYSSFFRDELDSDITLTLNPVTKRWGIKAARYSRTAETKYATPRWPIDQAIKSALDQTPVRVMDKDSNGNLIFNPQASEEAQVRVNALREAFAGSADGAVPGWIWNDDERSVRLEALYNKSFNRLVPQNFDGSHLSFPGLTATITDSAGQKVPFALRAHQKNAVARIIQNGNTLLAHVVGAGKTFTMIAAGMEQRRLGQKQRPMFIVPNHMLEQFSREFLQAYPGANILVAQKDEMTRENRKAFAAKIAAQKWDGIIITHDAFGRIRMSPGAYEEFTREEIESVKRAKIAAADEEGKKSPTVKDLEKLEKKLETKLANLIKEERKDEGVTFEELGVDQIYLDEAHLFKNLSFFTRHTRIKGIGGTASQRATDLFMKVRHLEKAYPGRAAVFATGTPVSNTMAEMYTMQRYLQLDTLKEYGVDEFDAWAATFGEVRSQMELGPDGRSLRETTSFSRFINIPELYAMYSRVADNQTADMLNLPRPTLKTGKVQVVEAEFSGVEESVAQSIVQRAIQLKGKKAEKGSDNMLKVVGDGRKLATDIRLLNPDAPYNPNGKTAKLIENVHRIWKKAEFPALAQIVFLDMGVPQNKAKASPATAVSEEEDTEEGADDDAETALASRFDLYGDIRDRLVARGIPREQIAFIHDANDDIKKARMFGKVRSGEIRVLIGSTGKMGVGTNVQRLLIALHHDDAPWKPAEVEQRNGRIQRQGNMNPEVEIFQYVTKKSMDAFMWQVLERKARFIGQLLSGARGIRHAEDIDSPLPDAADIKAAATGDPRIMEQADLTKRERELKVALSSHNRVITEAKRSVGSTEARITYLEGQAEAQRKDAETVQPTAGDKFAYDLGDGSGQRMSTDRKKVGEWLRSLGLNKGRVAWGPPRAHEAGYISSFPVNMFLKQSDDGIEYAFQIEGHATYGGENFAILTEDADPIGLVRRVENILAQIPQMAAYTADELARARKTLSNLKTAATEKPFPRQKELDEVSTRLKALNDEFRKENEKKPPPAPSGTTEGEQERLSSTQARQTSPNRFRFSISDRQARELAAHIQQTAERILGRHLVGVEVRRDLSKEFSAEEDAVYDPNTGLIWVALQGKQNPRTSIRHEAIHALRNAGVFTKQEWAALTRMAHGKWIEQYDIRARYERLYRERFDLTEAQIQELIVEEAIAEGYAEHVTQDRDDQSVAGRIFTRLRRFLEAVRNMLAGRGFTSVDQIIRGVDVGQFGRRSARAGQGRDFLLYAKQPQQDRLSTAQPQDVTKTEAFRKWFGDSKVVDEKGAPLVVYHATDREFDAFNTTITHGSDEFTGDNWFGQGSYFATNENDLYEHTGVPFSEKRVIPAYLSMKNPYRWQFGSEDRILPNLKAAGIDTNKEFQDGVLVRRGPEKFTAWAKSQGYDGVMVLGRDGTPSEIVAFNPTQIKSVFNRGTFDPKNPAILSSRQERLSAVPPDDGAPGRHPTGDPIREFAASAEAARRLEDLAGNINLRYIKAPEDVKQTLRDVAEQAGGFINARRGKISHEQTARLAAELGMSERELLKRKQGQAFNAEQLFAARALLLQSSKRLTSLASRAKTSGSTADLAEFHKAFTRHAAIQEQIAGMTAEAGRALNQFKMLAGQDYFKQARNIMENAKGKKEYGAEAVRELADMIDGMKDGVQIGRLTRSAFKTTTMDILRELWINARLSGLRTHATNILSNSLTALMQVPETAVAAAISGLRGDRDGVRAGEAMARLIGLMEGAREGMQNARIAWKTGEPTDVSSKLEHHNNKAIPGKIGAIVRIPSRGLMAADELFKAINYRAEINAQAVRLAMREGVRGDRLAARIAEYRNAPTMAMQEAAHQHALYQTFQNAMGPIARNLMNLREQIPGAWIVLPFIRTPANIFKYAAERTPFGLAMREVRERMASGDAVVRDTQMARLALGGMIAVGIASLAMAGLISGGGPNDDDEKKIKRATGWQPYSFKIGDTWYSYQRLDPLGFQIGLIADLWETGGNLESAEADKIGAVIIKAIADGVLNKTYLSGLSDFTEAMNDPDRYADGYLRNFAGTLIPTGVAQVAQSFDPVYRDARTSLDKIKSLIPGLSQALPARRDVFGEAMTNEGSLGPDLISPIYATSEKDNPIAQAMIDADYFPGMPRRTIGKHELTPEQYDRYAEISGKRAVQLLQNRVTAPNWKGLGRDRQEKIIKKGFDDAREFARKKMMREFPELRKSAEPSTVE